MNTTAILSDTQQAFSNHTSSSATIYPWVVRLKCGHVFFEDEGRPGLTKRVTINLQRQFEAL